MNVTAKKLFGVLLLALIFTASPARAEAASVDGYLFYGATCPHCANEKKFCPMSFKKVSRISPASIRGLFQRQNIELFQKPGRNWSHKRKPYRFS